LLLPTPALAQVEGRKLRDYKGDYEYFLEQNEDEAAKMEAKEEKAKEIAQDNIKAKSKMTKVRGRGGGRGGQVNMVRRMCTELLPVQPAHGLRGGLTRWLLRRRGLSGSGESWGMTWWPLSLLCSG
jgi:hypothetical protein